jgi:pilus assembly protein CpaB
MKPAKLAVLGIAVVAGGMAYYLSSSKPPPEAPAPVQQTVVQAKTTDVLVAAVDVPMGRSLSPNDLKWQAWPQDAVPPNVMTKADAPNSMQDVAGSITRSNFLNGEPIRKEKLIKADGSGFMSAILPAGMRAVAIAIDTRGSNSAGGFILPNDRVDVIRTYRDDEASRAQGVDVYVSETILTNIRVLAIGQNVQEKNGERVVTGENATLELEPRQAEMITLGQKTGQLSLALRSIADANKKGEPAKIDSTETSGLTIVRFGIPKTSPKR